MTFRAIKAIAATLMLGLPAALALAHTSLVNTSPASGAVLDQSPPIIKINFRDTARLTSVVVVEAGKPDRQLEFAPSGAAASFKVHEPRLGPGAVRFNGRPCPWMGTSSAGR